jgi:uncharacterized protein DUF4304
MDSKVVNRGIKSEIWPSLKKQGFDCFTSRTAWRHRDDRIDVVNFQSFNSYQASVSGCTTFSFAINLGCYFLTIPYQYGQPHIKEKSGYLLPDEAQCHIRGRIRPIMRRSLVARLLSRKAPQDIWMIHQDGSNLSSSLSEIQDIILTQGMQWFKQFERPDEVLRIFMCEPERIGELWGFGNNPSPSRNYLVGYVALAIGNNEVALAHLRAAQESGCFPNVTNELQTAIHAAAQQSGPAGSPPASVSGRR